MASALHKRLEKIEELLAAQMSGPLAWEFLPWSQSFTDADFDTLREMILDRMVELGEITPNQRHRVVTVRWKTYSGPQAQVSNDPPPEPGPPEDPEQRPAIEQPEQPEDKSDVFLWAMEHWARNRSGCWWQDSALPDAYRWRDGIITTA